MSESSAHKVSYADGLVHDPFPRQLLDAGKLARLVGVIGLGLLFIGWIFTPGWAFRSLLFASHFWLFVSLGCLGFVMISHLTGGGWGVVIRRIGEAGFLRLPLMLLFFVVLAFGYKYVFPWAHPQDIRADKTAYDVYQHREPLFNPTMFLVRTFLYFGIWMFLAVTLRVGSLKLDKGPDLVLRRKLRKISAFGMVIFFVTTTGYALDYVQSRETNWYSSIGGFIIAISAGQCGMCFMAIMVCYFANKRPLKDVLVPQHTNDLGNIMLSMVILFMYTNFAQYLIQWNGNMPEDYGYWTARGLGTVYNGWRYMTIFLLICGFFLPFFLLLMKGLKRSPATFAQIAGLILFMHLVYAIWIFGPSGLHRVQPGGAYELNHIYWTDFAAFAGVGGLWLSGFVRILNSKPLLANNVADQPEIVAHGAPAH